MKQLYIYIEHDFYFLKPEIISSRYSVFYMAVEIPSVNGDVGWWLNKPTMRNTNSSGKHVNYEQMIAIIFICINVFFSCL